MQTNRTVERVVLPSSIVLSPRVLAGVIRKFSTAEIASMVQTLVDELDIRSGDPDLELEADWEYEPAI